MAEKLTDKKISVSGFMTVNMQQEISQLGYTEEPNENDDIYDLTVQLDDIMQRYKFERLDAINDDSMIHMYVDKDGIVSFSSEPFIKLDDEEYTINPDAAIQDLYYARVRYIGEREDLVFFEGETLI